MVHYCHRFLAELTIVTHFSLVSSTEIGINYKQFKRHTTQTLKPDQLTWFLTLTVNTTVVTFPGFFNDIGNKFFCSVSSSLHIRFQLRILADYTLCVDQLSVLGTGRFPSFVQPHIFPLAGSSPSRIPS